MTTHAVSKSMRSAIWFDIYETMLCFTVSRAFVVTPKGERMSGAPLLNRLILLHLVLFGPPAVRVAVSLIRAAAWDFSPGMAISVFGAAVNLLLLGAVISTAYKPPQRQQCVRVPLYLPCEVLVGNRRLMGVTSDLSEAGAQLVVPEPLEASADGLFVRFLPEGEAPISVRWMVVRQERGDIRHCRVWVQFGTLPVETRHRLIRLMFSSHQTWKGAKPAAALWKSFWAVIRGIPSAYVPYKPSRRRVPRIPCLQRGRLVDEAQQADVQLRDISCSGVSLWTRHAYLVDQDRVAFLELDAIRLKIRPQRMVPQNGGRLFVCSVESGERGESEWAELHRHRWDKLYTPAASPSVS